MYKFCKTEKSLLRQKLFQSTLLSMMHRQNYQEISVTALCKELSLPRKTFYRYFDTLEDVLNSIMDEALDQCFLCMEVTLDLEGFFLQWSQQKDLLDALQRSGLSHFMVSRIYHRLGQSMHKDTFSTDDIRYSASISAIMTMVFTWHHNGMQQSAAEMSTLARSLLRFPETAK